MSLNVNADPTNYWSGSGQYCYLPNDTAEQAQWVWKDESLTQRQGMVQRSHALKSQLWNSRRWSALSRQFIVSACNREGPCCYLPYFWPFVKENTQQLLLREADGWMTFTNVFFWWRNWGTKWLFVFPNLLKPGTSNFEITVYVCLLSPAGCRRKGLPMGETASVRGFREGRPSEEPHFCVCHRWPTGGASQCLPLHRHPPSSDSFLHHLV